MDTPTSQCEATSSRFAAIVQRIGLAQAEQDASDQRDLWTGHDQLLGADGAVAGREQPVRGPGCCRWKWRRARCRSLAPWASPLGPMYWCDARSAERGFVVGVRFGLLNYVRVVVV